MEKSAGDSSTIARDNRFPPGIPYIVGNEGAERFSYYGMRQILYIYLTALFIGFVRRKQRRSGSAFSGKNSSNAVDPSLHGRGLPFPDDRCHLG